MDTWKQSEKEKHDLLGRRLTEVYKRAAKATFITSFTTTVAFLSNVPSPLLAISSFGIFSAVLVMVNYLSVILFFPSVMIIHHVYLKERCCCGSKAMYGKRVEEAAPSTNVEIQPSYNPLRKSATQRIAEFFEGWFFRNIISHKIICWLVIGLFVLALAVLIVFATKLGPDEEKV